MSRHERDRKIVQALLRYGRRNPSGEEPMILRNPNAFLLWVLYDYLIPWERAWSVPRELRKRLGHLNFRRIAVISRIKLRRAIRKPPALHRFINVMVERTRTLAQIIVRRYRGSGANLWRTAHSMEEIKERLNELPGVGVKLAAMTMRLLMGAGIRKQNGHVIDIAPDVHVRRVFRRAGLVREGKPAEVIAAARRLHPRFPGGLDFSTWKIGIELCHPRTPACQECPLRTVCRRRGIKPSRIRSSRE